MPRIFKLLLLALMLLQPVWAGAVVVTVPVSSGNNDAEQDLPGGNMDRGSSDLELAYEGNQRQTIGMRFQNVSVPAGSFITNAYIQFTVDETDSGTTNLIVVGEDVDDAVGFTNGNSNISNRLQTSASVNWNNVPPWNTVGASGLDQRTPNLAAIVQEIVDRGGWSSGNDMVMMIEPGSGCNSSACQRTAESRNSGAGSAPVLVIDYATVIPNTADLSLTKVDSSDPVDNGGIINYTITVNNLGPLDATNVTITDPLPAGVGFISAVANQGTCTFLTGTVSCNVGTVISGSSAMVYLVVTMPMTGGSIVNTATVVSDQPDGNMANNTATETTSVTPLNSEQLCYLVADQGGGAGGDDLLTTVDTANSGGEVAIGAGTGTFNIEAIAWRADVGVLYGANANRLGIISTTTGAFFGTAQPFGTGGGSVGNVNLNDVDSLAWDPITGMLFGAHSRGGNDLLFVINVSTGTHVPNAFGPGVDYVQIQPILGNTITDDIAVDPLTGVMYASVNAGGTTDRLIIVDKTNGATTDVSLMSVPDIEGMGTDQFGQLWGVSGTQNILYEIDKNTGVGSNPRPLGLGTDYEALDCHAVSPSTIVDIDVNKTVDLPTPVPGDDVEYTITVTNSGPGTASILQIADALPTDVTFVSSIPSVGAYDSVTGVWFVGMLASGSSETLILNVNVDAGTAGSTITNTASLLSVFQNDTNSTNNISSVDINPPGPDIVTSKSSLTLSDPYTTSGNPKAIPGAIVQYTIVVDNNGAGPADADTVVITDAIPAFTALVVDDFDGINPGPVAFSDGSPASGVGYNFASLASTTDNISFSDNSGTSFDYTPVDSGDGTDPDVTHIRIQFSGSFLGDAGAGRQFSILFKTHVQ